MKKAVWKASDSSSTSGKDKRCLRKREDMGKVWECKKKNEEAELCGKCHGPVKEKDMGLKCDLCQLWFHGKCEKVTEGEYQMLMSIDEKVKWFCDGCKEKVENIQEENRELNERINIACNKNKDLMIKINQIERKLTEFEKTKEEYIQKVVERKVKQAFDDLKNDTNANMQRCIKKEIERCEERINQNRDKVEQLASYRAREKEATATVNVEELEKMKVEIINSGLEQVEERRKDERKSMKEIQNKMEELDREKRQNNLVVYNMKESNEKEPQERYKHDEDSCMRLFTGELGVNVTSFTQLVRLGKRDTHRPRPLLVKLAQDRKAMTILREAKKLRFSTNFIKVYISKDLTKTERENEKRLRMELYERRSGGNQLNERFVIRKGKVIKEVNGQSEERTPNINNRT